MKFKLSKTAAGSIIFLFIIASVFLFLQPLYRAMNTLLSEFEEKYLGVLADKTGLTISYESLSPSILTGISMKGIVVSDVENSTEILAAEKIVVNYSLRHLLSGDFQNVFTEVRIYDVSFDYNSAKLASVEEKFRQLFPKKEHAEQTLFVPRRNREILKQVLFSLPFDIQLKNVSFRFSRGTAVVNALINEAQVRKNRRTQSLTGTFNGYLKATAAFMKGTEAGVHFDIKGNLLKSIDGSLFNIHFSDLEESDFSVYPLSCLILYDGTSFVLHSTEHIKPYNIMGYFNPDAGTLGGTFTCSSLNPLDVVRIPPLKGILERLPGSKLTTLTSAEVDLKTMRFNWDSDSTVAVSTRFLPGNETAHGIAHGDNDFITAKNISLRGEFASADFRGNMSMKTFLPSGLLSVHYLNMPNGNPISGDVTVRGEKGAINFSLPEFYMGQRLFSNIRASIIPRKASFDFSFYVPDYSHPEFAGLSAVQGEGNFSFAPSPYLQCSVQVNNIFLDTVAWCAAWCTDPQDRPRIGKFTESLSPFIMSTELYFASDLKDVVYNVPYSIFANTLQDRQFLILSFDGNRTSINVSQADLIYGKNSLMAVFSADISPEDNQLIFNTDFTVNSIPYSLSGIYSTGEWLNITGSYGLNIVANFSYGITGSMQFASLPVKIHDLILSASSESTFTFNSLDDFSFDFHTLEFEEVGNRLPLHPKVSVSASLDSKGVVFSSFFYADSFSTLEGKGYTLWNINHGILDSLTAELELKNPVSMESLVFSGNMTNPLGEAITMETLSNECYFSAQAQVAGFPLRRIFTTQPVDETFSAVVTASGTLENPYISVDLSNFSMQIGGSPLIMKGNLAVMENRITVPSFSAKWQSLDISDASADLDIDSFQGTASFRLYSLFGEKDIKAPVSLTVENLSPYETSGIIPESFSVSMDSEEVSGSLLKEPFPFNITLIRSPGRIDIVTNEYLGAYGEYLDDGTLNVSILEDKMLHFDMSGTLTGKSMNLTLSNIYADLSSLSYLFNSDKFSVHNGIVSGTLLLSGIATDPNVEGEAFIHNFDFNLPSYIPEHFKTDEVVVEFTQDEIEVQDTPFTIQNASVVANAYASLDRWKIASFEFNVYTEQGSFVPVDIKIPRFRLKGLTSMKTSLSWESGALELSGNVNLKNAEINLITNTGMLSGREEEQSSRDNSLSNLDMRISMLLNIGPKVHFALDPLVRGLIAPDTPVEFSMDTAAGLWNIKGDVVLRGGEVSYLNRSFYLKEGRIILNETQDSINPNITVRAETKEHDLNGDPVTISLSAIRQNAQDFDPILSSIPAKSENEIMEILGNIASGDSNDVSGLFLSGVDYGVQVTVLRRLENALRDLCNFDIFSIRTTLLQNSIRQGFNMNTGSEKGSLISNLFDNSTVYIGKYFGNSIYVDALLHWTYDENRSSASDSAGGGLVFQPEIGLELEAPFANIRWSFAPDLGELQQSWVQSTSITLSWRLNF